MKKVLLAVLAMMATSAISGFAEETNTAATSATNSAAAAKPIYALYLEGEASYVLSDIEEVEFHGIKCLKGKHISMTWVKNKIIYVPVDKVSAIIEFDSVEKYKQDIDKFQKGRMQME